MPQWIRFLLSAALLLTLAVPVVAAEYHQYMTPAETRQYLESQQPLTLVDIQVEDQFARHHIQSAVPTYAYPDLLAD